MVAFGDVSGFNPWIRRGSNAPEVIKEFIEIFYSELQKFVIANRDCQIKYLGDGFMVLKEFKSPLPQNISAAKFVMVVSKLSKQLVRIVNECGYPPPDGFRVRITSGHVSKMMVIDPCDSNRKRKNWEFIGYAVNLAEKLLSVAPEILILLHESAVKSIGQQKVGFRIRKFVAESARPRGVDIEDLNSLWVGEY
jgi:class 3 adenylate cyclase